MSLQPGTPLGPCEILTAPGAGGMGEVYKAEDARLVRFVAVEVMPGSAARVAQACVWVSLDRPVVGR
jgi:hypothetical protein